MIIFLAVVLLGGVTLLVLNTDWFRIKRLKKQLESKYGVAFEVEGVKKEDNPSINDGGNGFMITSGEGIRAYARTNWAGSLISDSFAHYYYAADMNKYIESIIGPCFDACYIVRDCLEYGSNLTQFEFVDDRISDNFEDYLNSSHEVTVTFRIYLHQKTPAKQIEEAMDLLKKQGIDYSAYFLRVSDQVYDMLSDSGLSCYYPFSHIYESLKKNAGPVPEEEIDRILSDPFSFTVAEYIPKYDTAKMIITREYFEQLDKERSRDEIIDEIGRYGVEGSGIIYHIWHLSDGTKAAVVFDSSGKIVRIYIQGNGTSEMIYERYPKTEESSTEAYVQGDEGYYGTLDDYNMSSYLDKVRPESILDYRRRTSFGRNGILIWYTYFL